MKSVHESLGGDISGDPDELANGRFPQLGLRVARDHVEKQVLDLLRGELPGLRAFEVGDLGADDLECEVANREFLFPVRGCPTYIRSDNGPEFVAAAVKTFLGNSGVETLSIESGSPWENGYIESFTARM